MGGWGGVGIKADIADSCHSGAPRDALLSRRTCWGEGNAALNTQNLFPFESWCSLGVQHLPSTLQILVASFFPSRVFVLSLLYWQPMGSYSLLTVLPLTE